MSRSAGAAGGAGGAGASAAMVTPDEARDQGRRRLRASQRGWTLQGWEAPVWSLPLHAPTERRVLGDPAAAEAWVRSWRGLDLPTGVTVTWEDRRWRSVGTQRVPVRLTADSPAALGAFVGGREAREATRFARRADRVRALAVVEPGGVPAGEPGTGAGTELSAVLRRHAERLTGLDEDEFTRLVEVAAWLREHPVSGLRPRQLPIRGVDSKWFSRHRALLAPLHAALFGKDTGLGIVDADRRVRLRVLDERLRPTGPMGAVTDLEVPVTEAAGLDWAPENVLVVENQETLLCLPEAADTVAVWGRGFDATASMLPWVRGAQVLYWGDLDSQGFAVLHRYRSHLPHIETVMMDESTLEAFADLWVPEPTPFRGALGTLVPAELRTVERLRAEGDVRLEQERIDWNHALGRLGEHLPLRSGPHPPLPVER